MAVDVSQLRTAVGRLSRRVFDDAAQSMLRDAEGAAPFDTGETVRTARLTERGQTETAQRAKLRFPAPQAAYTNDGTRPHVIRPRSKQALAFTIGGQRIIVKSVQHPGNPATHWFDETVTDRRWHQLCQRAASQITVT